MDKGLSNTDYPNNRQEKSQAENPTSMTFEDCEDKSEHSPHFHNKNKFCDGRLWNHPKKQRIKEI